MGMRVVAFRMPARELRELDRLVKRGVFKSRSHAIRFAIRKLLEEVVA
jgi:Arc/MetJ-type ribon-helix-helix transcriptional regulator